MTSRSLTKEEADILKSVQYARVRHPNRVACWIDKVSGDNTLPDTENEKKKYLIESDMNLGQVMYIIRKRVKIDSKKAIFLFVENVLAPNSTTMGELYKEHARPDGLLYITYRAESTFG